MSDACKIYGVYAKFSNFQDTMYNIIISIYTTIKKKWSSINVFYLTKVFSIVDSELKS